MALPLLYLMEKLLMNYCMVSLLRMLIFIVLGVCAMLVMFLVTRINSILEVGSVYLSAIPMERNVGESLI